MTRWIVLLDSSHGRYAYGPIGDVDMAGKFAKFMTQEVDPAQPIRLIEPMDELLGYLQRESQAGPPRPVGWPPRPGEIWQDDQGNRWACARTPHADVSYLVCLAHQGDDNAEEIWRQFGPMTRVQYVAPTHDEEPPF